MISEGYRTHGGVTAPMIFKKKGRFFRKIVLPGFWDPDSHPSTLIDLAKIDLANTGSVETKCMIAEVYRTHSVVTGPMNFKKSGHFFSGKSCSRDFGTPGCHPGTLIDLVSVALDSRDSVETICMIWEGCRTHRVVTGPMNFKKSGHFFFPENHAPGFLGPLAAIQAL